MPGKSGFRRKTDPEAALREYFNRELGKYRARLPRLPGLPVLPAVKVMEAVKAVNTRADKTWITIKLDRPGSCFRNNLATLFLAACVLGLAALALSCSPRAALASSIGEMVKGQGLETLRQDTIKVVGVVWQEGQEYFRQKRAGIVGATGIPAAEKESL